MSRKTVYSYLKRTDLGSDKFRYKLMSAFDVDFNELILTTEEQIRRFATTIFDEYHKYKSKDDLITFKKIIELCEEENMIAEKLKMERNTAMYYFNNNRSDRAIELLKEATENAYNHRCFNHWLYFNCDIAFIYGFNNDLINAQRIFDKINLDNAQRVIDISFRKRAMYKYYYGYGVLCNRTKQHDKAQKLFTESLNYIRNDIDKGVSLTGIGLSYKKKWQFDKALEYYFKALKIQSSKTKKIALYNNIAELYKQKKEYEKAIKMVKKAINLLENQNKENTVQFSFTAYLTYLEIKVLKNDVRRAIEELLSWVYEGNSNFVTKYHLTQGLNIIVDLATRKEQYDVLEMTENIILGLMRTEHSKPYISNLQEILGKISTIFYLNNIEKKYLYD